MMEAIVAQLRQQLIVVSNRVRHVLHRARVSAPANETGGVQMLQVTNFQGSTTRDVRSYQQYGFASSPLTSCEVLLVHENGDSSRAYAIATNDGTLRPINLPPGSAQMYDNFGDYIKLSEGKMKLKSTVDVEITTTGNVTVNAPKLVVNGDIEATGDIKAGSVSLKTHKHLNSGGSGIGGTPQQ